jgi:hypothetical protein
MVVHAYHQGRNYQLTPKELLGGGCGLLVNGVEPGLVVAREEGDEVERKPRQPVHGEHEHAPPVLRLDLLEQQGCDEHGRSKPLEREQGNPDPGEHDTGGCPHRHGRTSKVNDDVDEHQEIGEDHPDWLPHVDQDVERRHVEPGEKALPQRPGVAEAQLEMAAHPAHALIPGGAHREGLLVVDVRIPRPGRANALQDALDGELQVLGEGMGIPADLVDERHGHAGARSTQHGGKADIAAGELPETVGAPVPDGTRQRDPRIPGVLHVEIPLDGTVAHLRITVDLAQEVSTDQVVRVEYRHHVVRRACRLDARQEPADSVALAGQDRIRAFIDNGSVPTGHVGGIVRAVVRDDVDVEELTWIGLPCQRIQHVADDMRLVMRRNEHGKPREGVSHRWFAPLEEPEQRHDRLIGEQDEDTGL